MKITYLKLNFQNELWFDFFLILGNNYAFICSKDLRDNILNNSIYTRKQ